MLHVVLDPVVMLRALINPHSPCGQLLSEYADRYRAVFSQWRKTHFDLTIGGIVAD